MIRRGRPHTAIAAHLRVVHETGRGAAVPRPRVEVGQDPEIPVGLHVLHGSGTGADPFVIRKGVAGIVGDHGVQVQPLAAVRGLQGQHAQKGIPRGRLFRGATLGSRGTPSRPVGNREADAGPRVYTRLQVVLARGEQENRKQYRQAPVPEPPA